MNDNPLPMGQARAALSFLLDDGIVVDAQVAGLMLSTNLATAALEARLTQLGWDGTVAFAALGQAFDFAYYAYDTREFGLDTAGAAASRIVTELREGVV